VQAVLGIVDNFATEGSSAFSVMSAAVGSSNTIEVLTRRFQQVREGGRSKERREGEIRPGECWIRSSGFYAIHSLEPEFLAHWQHYTALHYTTLQTTK
jgi:hypothetical protein